MIDYYKSLYSSSEEYTLCQIISLTILYNTIYDYSYIYSFWLLIQTILTIICLFVLLKLIIVITLVIIHILLDLLDNRYILRNEFNENKCKCNSNINQ